MVFFGPDPRSVTLLGTVTLLLIRNVPLLSKTNPLAAHEFNAFWIVLVASFDPPGELMVDPHCVRFVGIPPGMPALDQSIARVGSRMPAQFCWPCDHPEKQTNNTMGKSNALRLIVSFLDRSIIRSTVDEDDSSLRVHNQVVVAPSRYRTKTKRNARSNAADTL